jgi:nicotinate-nucleotide adenylyltransferase
MSDKAMKVGIFGGTFDPIHLGHLIIVEEARQEVGLDQIWFIPAGEPPHKQGKNITPAHHRARMVELAIQCNPFFSMSTLEIERQGPSYTVDTLEILTEKHPNHHFFLIVGADMVKDLLHWYKIKKILQFVRVIGLGRPGFETKSLPDFIKHRVTWVNKGVETNLSSTYIRNQLKHGKSVRYLVPKPVYQYMKEHGLYGS